MPANIFVLVVQVLSQNLGLAGFIALGREEDDRNTGFLWNGPVYLQRVHAKSYYSKAGASKVVSSLEV